MLRYGSGYFVNLGPLNMVAAPLPWRDYLVSDTIPGEYEIVVSKYGGASLYSAQGLSVEKVYEPKKKWVPYAGPACASALAMTAGFFIFDISNLLATISSFGLFYSRSITVVFLFLITGVVFLISVSFYIYYYFEYRKRYHESVSLARSTKERLDQHLDIDQ